MIGSGWQRCKMTTIGTANTIHKINVARICSQRIATTIWYSTTVIRAGTACFAVAAAAPIPDNGIVQLEARRLSLARSGPNIGAIIGLARLVAEPRIITNGTDIVFTRPNAMAGSIHDGGSSILAWANVCTAVDTNSSFSTYTRQGRIGDIVSTGVCTDPKGTAKFGTTIAGSVALIVRKFASIGQTSTATSHNNCNYCLLLSRHTSANNYSTPNLHHCTSNLPLWYKCFRNIRTCHCMKLPTVALKCEQSPSPVQEPQGFTL